MKRTIQLIGLTAILCAGCESGQFTSGAALNELEVRGGLVYLKGDTQPYTGVHHQPINIRGGKVVAQYRYGQRHGQWEEWYNARQQFSKSEWANGRLINGTTWRPDGTEGGRVINGNGSMIRFSPAGVQIKQTHFRNGLPVTAPPAGAPPPSTLAPVKTPAGLYLHPSNGEPFHGVYDYIEEGCRYKGRMTHGRRDGLIRVWYSGGAPLKEADYSKGIINGRFVEWYPNGDRMVDAIFQRGRLIRATSWQLGGKVASDLPKGTGTLILFYPDGGQRRESVYEQGVKVTRKVE